MDFITPITMTDAILTGSNVPENDHDEWVNCEFSALNQTGRWWRGLAAHSNGNIYASVDNGDIYMRTAGSGDFAPLSQTNRAWRGLSVCSSNGHVYCCVLGGDIYKQTSGAGNFNALSAGTQNWRGVAAAPNGDVYACVYGGDIYKQTSGAGGFNALSAGNKNWWAMTAAPNGDIYACVDDGDIYKQTSGTGSFVALGQINRDWYGLAADANGNIYAIDNDGYVYVQKGGTGSFVALNSSSDFWTAICAASDGSIYVSIDGDDIVQSDGDAFYSDGDTVVVSSSGVHKSYESLTNNNFNNNPSTDTANWIELESTNRWKAFNGILGSQTEQSTQISYVLAPGAAIDSVALLNLESDTVDIIEIDNSDNLITNGESWTGATGTTQPTGWDKVGTPAAYAIDGGMIKITTDAANEGQSQTIAVSAATEYQLLGKYKNTAGDIAQIAIYDVTHSADILATTDLASSTVESIFSQVFTTPAGCVSIKISLMGKANGDIVWFDAVTLAPTEYSETVTTGTSKTDLVKLDIPQIATGILTVNINKSGSAAIGELIIGTKTTLGTMRYSPQIGITDYSTKTQDTFGNWTIIQRTYSKRLTCNLRIANTNIDSVFKTLSDCRSEMRVWIGDEDYSCLIVYGFYKDFQIVIPYPNYSDCSLEIEGII